MDLNALFQSNPGAFVQGQEALRFKRQQDMADLEAMLQKTQQSKEMFPIQKQQAQAGLESTLLGNTAQGFKNQALDRDNQFQITNRATLYKAKLQEALASTSEADQKIFMGEVDNMLRSPDPKVRAAGKQLWQGTREYMMDKERMVLRQAIANAQREGAMDRERERTRRQELNNSFRLNIARVNNQTAPKNREALAAALTNQMFNEPDPERREILSEQLNFISNQIRAEKQADADNAAHARAAGAAANTPQIAGVPTAPLPAGDNRVNPQPIPRPLPKATSAAPNLNNMGIIERNNAIRAAKAEGRVLVSNTSGEILSVPDTPQERAAARGKGYTEVYTR